MLCDAVYLKHKTLCDLLKTLGNHFRSYFFFYRNFLHTWTNGDYTKCFWE